MTKIMVVTEYRVYIEEYTRRFLLYTRQPLFTLPLALSLQFFFFFLSLDETPHLQVTFTRFEIAVRAPCNSCYEHTRPNTTISFLFIILYVFLCAIYFGRAIRYE